MREVHGQALVNASGIGSWRRRDFHPAGQVQALDFAGREERGLTRQITLQHLLDPRERWAPGVSRRRIGGNCRGGQRPVARRARLAYAFSATLCNQARQVAEQGGPVDFESGVLQQLVQSKSVRMRHQVDFEGGLIIELLLSCHDYAMIKYMKICVSYSLL